MKTFGKKRKSTSRSMKNILISFVYTNLKSVIVHEKDVMICVKSLYISIFA